MAQTEVIFIQCIYEDTMHTPASATHARGYLNIKMSSYQYSDPHVKDKAVSQRSYL